MATLEASREETVDVAVVGGGPGGLATAAAVISVFGGSASVKVRNSPLVLLISLRIHSTPFAGMPSRFGQLTHSSALLFRLSERHRAKVPLQVFESQKAFKLQGSVIGVAVNAQHALEAVHPDLLTRLKSCAPTSRRAETSLHLKM